ncbi:MAG TPA: hypothetical protein VHR36_04435, partial [Pyrinomonadaceae bacterium]|nr:hypothetical protein [Pyrinomonadaceae bacterium]
MRIRHTTQLTLLAALFVIALNNSQSQAQSMLAPMPQVGPVEEHLPRKADTTPQRLDQMHLPSEPVSLGPPEVKPVRLNPNVSVSLALSPDGALQSSPGPAHPVTIGLNKEGIGDGFPNFQVQNAPPDTSGAVGKTQFVQWVNTSFAVFDKSGNRLLGPIKGKFLWQGL